MTQHTTKSTIKPFSRFKLFFAFITLIILSLLIVSVYQINRYAAELYFIHSAGDKIAQLSQENQALEVSLTRANSLSNIGVHAQNFERVVDIKFIRILEGTALAR